MDQSTLRKLFIAAQLLVLVSVVAIWLGGIASAQAYCFQHQAELKPGLSNIYAMTTRSSNASCSTFLRFTWWSFSYALFAIVLTLLMTVADTFTAFRAAVWSILTSSAIIATCICNAAITMLSRDSTPDTLQTRVLVMAIGMALFCFFAFASMFAGSAYSYQTKQPMLQGYGAETRVYVNRLGETFSRSITTLSSNIQKSKKAFLVSQAIAWIGCVLALIGVAGAQSYCYSSYDNVMAKKLPWVQDFPDYTMDCAVVFSDKWFAWALSFVTLLLVVLSTGLRFPKFKSAIWATIVSSVSLNMLWINNLIDVVNTVQGAFRSWNQIAVAGFIIYDIGALLIILAGSAYANSSYTARMESGISNTPKRNTETLLRRLRNVFLVLQACAVISSIICVVGLSLYQHYYNNNDDALNSLTFSIGQRYHWFTWSLQLITLLLLILLTLTKKPLFRQLKSALWLVAMYAVTLNIISCSHLYRALGWLTGDVKTYVTTMFVGYLLWDTFMYLTMFMGSLYLWESQNARAEASTAREEPAVAGPEMNINAKHDETLTK